MCFRRFPLFSLSLFLALLLFPSCALALDIIPKGVFYQGDVQGTNYGAVVSAYNQYDAACYVLGKDPNTISSSIKAKLSDPVFGGRFYEYAQSFFTQSGALEDMPEWVPTYIFWGSEVMDLVLADYQAVWYSTTTKALHDAALVDFARILNGEDLGGGSGSPSASLPPGDYYEIDTSDAGMYPYPAGREVNKIYLSVDFVDAYLAQFASATPARKLYVYVRTDSLGTHAGVDCVISWSLSGSPNWYVKYDGLWYMSGGMQWFLDDDNNWYYAYLDGQPLQYAGNGTNTGNNFVSAYGHYHFACDFSRDFPVVHIGEPGGDWPQNPAPVTPTAPELPDPVTPTVTPEPTVTEPTPTWPVIPTPTVPTVTLTDTPSGLDYTQLLTLINDNLNDINSYTVAINSNFNSLRSDLVSEFNGVVQALRNIYQYLQHMDNVLERHCVHLQNKMEDVSVDIQNKMRELAHWLAEQLDFDSESSGNSDLFGILSTISDKLGGGTYEPNPIRDEQGYYEWLDDLWDRFLLGDDWESSVSGISSSFGQLKTRFPFSVPWDIVALFRLFVHDPVTPEFDLPLYFSPDSSTPVHVDLSAWDDVASIVRPLVYVIFALKLALLSRDLLGGLGADKGGL